MNNLQKSIRITYLAFIDEFRRVIRDPGAVLVLLGAMIIYPVIYSIAYKNNVLNEVPIAVIDSDKTSLSRKASMMLDATEQLNVTHTCTDMSEAQKLFWDNQVKGIVYVPKGFEKNAISGNQSDVSVYCDASYFLIYKQTLSGCLGAIQTLSAGVEIKRMMAAGAGFNQALAQRNPLSLQIKSLFNPGEAYGSYVMPGIIFIILQQTLLVGIGMVSGSRREKKQSGHYLQSVKNNGHFLIVVLGRSFSYFFIYIFNIIFTLVYVYHWFGFPDKSMPFEIIVLLIPYVFAVIFLGLSTSQIFSQREHSIMVLVFLSPIIMFLSGISWPAEAIPRPLYYLAHIFPSTTATPAYLRLRTMGVDLSFIEKEFFFTVGLMLIYLVTAVFSLKRAHNKIQAEKAIAA
ncbi:MAG: ABC transporter permease [Bacteroidales bacterium]|nr:ABC transporter permease [Bacteroidales bacterium]